MEPQIGKYYITGWSSKTLVFYCLQIKPFTKALVMLRRNKGNNTPPRIYEIKYAAITLQDDLIEFTDPDEIKELDRVRKLSQLID